MESYLSDVLKHSMMYPVRKAILYAEFLNCADDGPSLRRFFLIAIA